MKLSKMLFLRTSSLFFALPFIGTNLSANVFTYAVSGHDFYYTFNLNGISSFPGGRFSNKATDSYLQVTIDTSALTLKVDEFWVEFADSNIKFTENFTVNFGQSADYEFEMSARPFSFRITDGDVRAITPGTGGTYSLPGFTSAGRVEADPIIIDYKITSANETIFGTTEPFHFSQTPTDATLNISGDLETSGFPDTISLGRTTINMGNPNPSSQTILQAVEGGELSFMIAVGWINVNPYDQWNLASPVQLTLIPEPSSYGILLGFLALIVCVRIRKKAL